MPSEVPGVRVRVFGWPETWRVVPEPTDDGWRFRLVLAPGSSGRAAPPFVERTEWTAPDLPGGLALVKDEIRELAERARKRAFLVDEEPEDL
jgi:hypothetical protein